MLDDSQSSSGLASTFSITLHEKLSKKNSDEGKGLVGIDKDKMLRVLCRTLAH